MYRRLANSPVALRKHIPNGTRSQPLSEWLSEMKRRHADAASRRLGPVPVGGALGEYPAHAAAWVGYVAVVAGDDVYVCVADGLACGFEHVESDVESVWLKLGFDVRVYLVN